MPKHKNLHRYSENFFKKHIQDICFRNQKQTTSFYRKAVCFSEYLIGLFPKCIQYSLPHNYMQRDFSHLLLQVKRFPLFLEIFNKIFR